jgi:hypothetical protein
MLSVSSHVQLVAGLNRESATAQAVRKELVSEGMKQGGAGGQWGLILSC